MDILIFGATRVGMTRALSLAKEGHRVQIVTELFYPGEDLWGTMRAYSDVEARKWIASVCGCGCTDTPAALKKALLKKLTDENIEIIFASRFAAPLLSGGRLAGAVVMMPNGLRVMECQAIMDATMLGVPSFITAGKKPLLPAGAKVHIRAAVLAEDEGSLAKVLPAGTELLHDAADPQRYYLHTEERIGTAMTPSEATAFAAARRAALLTAVSTAGAESDTAQPQMLETELEAPRCFVPGFILPDDPLPEGEARGLRPDTVVLSGVRLPFDPEKGITREQCDSLEKKTCGVLVCGGGTAGAWAAIAAARAGADTVCIEKMGTPGGTRTLGGVTGLYCGNRSQLFQSMWNEIQEYSISVVGRPVNNQVVESLFLLEEMERSGVRLISHACIVRANVQGRRIASVLVAGDDGLYSVSAAQYIDATGEGLLCHLAGCASEVGDPELHMTQNYSQWNRCTKARRAYRPVDQNMLNAASDSEWMRCIRFDLEHAEEYDLFEILTPRETRRIKGRNTVTLRTVARGTRWPDTIYDAYSTFDPHGRSFGREGRLGALPALGHGRFAAIPLGAILPKELDDVLLTGKAISCTQEGMNFIRMNADVMSLGHIAGSIAAKCVSENKHADELDLSELQGTLLRQGALVFPIPEKKCDQVTAASLFTRVLAGEDETVMNDVILAQPEELGEMLRQARANQTWSKSEMIDMALLLYGDAAVGNDMLALLSRLDAENGTVRYQDRQRDTGVILGGVHGRADAYWQMNRLMVLLADNRCEGLIPVLNSVLSHTVPGGEWFNPSSVYSSIRLDTNTIPNYDRILCLAYAIKKMPSECFLEGMKRLYTDIAAIPAPDAKVWRDYLLLKLAQAYHKCGGNVWEMMVTCSPDLDCEMIRDGFMAVFPC